MQQHYQLDGRSTTTITNDATISNNNKNNNYKNNNSCEQCGSDSNECSTGEAQGSSLHFAAARSAKSEKKPAACNDGGGGDGGSGSDGCSVVVVGGGEEGMGCGYIHSRAFKAILNGPHFLTRSISSGFYCLVSSLLSFRCRGRSRSAIVLPYDVYWVSKLGGLEPVSV
ncbi:Hypothetical predicted protein [Octopus vulgaris]|uniref:Uncharacterized protein n=1 Tax=Octopus vulgaris TaxID=6645 RepID=A0AA36BF48_OCTVU|nr:Hypothetical predicted protein [Octopus vulgaris]